MDTKTSALTHLLEPISEIQDAFMYLRKVHVDDRGSFNEVLRDNIRGLPKFVQQNTSLSYGGVLRGMHAQKKNPQGKLVSCVYGTILDVVFDIRPNSPTFGKGIEKVLSNSMGNSIYAPPGCLHGFIALSRFAVVHYSCTTYYEAEHDGGVNWQSPEIRGFFPEDITPMVSRKDLSLPTLSEYLSKLD